MQRSAHVISSPGPRVLLKLVGTLSLAALIVALSTVATTVPPARAMGVVSTTSSGHEFDGPSAIVALDGDLWVTNEVGNSLTQVAASNGTWLKTYRSARFGFNSPDAIAALGSHLFIANAGGSVSEVLASNGTPVAVLEGSGYGFDDPVAIAGWNETILVVNAGSGGSGGSVTEINSVTGKVRRVLSKTEYGFDGPSAIAVEGGDAFVTDQGSNSVTEIDVPTGALVGLVSGSGLDSPDGLAATTSGTVWAADSGSNALTELAGSPLAAVATYSDSDGNYGFGSPSVTIAHSGNIYVTSPFGSSPMVTKVSATSGAADWYMCNTNGPYYFSDLIAMAASGSDIWVVSNTGANNPNPAAATGSLTELEAGSGALVATFPG